mmetsp:Transcript_25543/g.52872  ORF Transcript_25543/g.52872 Transcript_25543/m.52872 type:complete len:299 (-) Transcript_25543:254-1150(-)
MAQSPEMQSALADFKAANVTEIRSLCGAGLSRSNAISKILERICESKDPAKVVQEADMTEAAGLAHRLGMAADDALHSLIVRREMRKIKAGGNVSDAEAVVELTRRIRVEVPTRPAPLPTATSPIASSSAAAATAAVSPPHASATGAALSPSAGTKPCVAKPHQAGPHRKRGEAGSPGGLERSSSLKRTRRSTSNGKPGAKPGKPAAAKQAAEQVQTEMDADKEKELARQVAALTGEINEAMRSGDRMNIARLMRQREQLRAAAKRSRSLPPPATGGAAAEKEGGSEGGETKRSRVST